LDAGTVTWTALASIPGREGTLSHSWKNHSARLNVTQMDDICLYVWQTVQNCILCIDGAQLEILLEP
jgi:hypothetical protein